jgi:CDP-diglyceride synthetase
VRGVLLALLMTGLSGVAAYAAMNWVTPQQAYHSVLLTLSAFGESWSAGVAALIERFLYNAGRYFDPSKSAIDLLLTIQVLLVVVVVALSLVMTLALRGSGRRLPFWVVSTPRELAFHLYNLIVILVASFFLYIIGTFGDYRVVGLHLLLTLVLLVMSYHLLSPLIFVNLFFFLGLPFFFNASDYFAYYDGMRFGDHERVQDIRLPEELRYDPEAPSPWCNTLIIDVILYRDFLVAVPPGIGISWVMSFKDWQGEALKSRYVWMRGSQDDNETLIAKKGWSLRYLSDMPQGQLYLNEASACPR